jgi:type I restriction enzyme S subunit
VEKVERLLGLCNELEEKKEKRDQKQVNLNNASLEKLLASSEADEFRKCWSKISENFDILYDSPENVNKLKQAILQLAVMGKLVPQDPRDEPASILLEKIKAEKEQLIKEGKIKRQDPLPLIAENEMPYELPEGWKWVKLAHISNNIHYGYTASADLKINKIKFLRISDIQNNTVNWNTVPGCKINASDLKSYELHNGDLLIARTGGTIGKSYLVEDLKLCSAFASYLIRIIPSSFIYPKYLKYFSGSLLYWKQLYARCTGTGQPNVNGVSLSNLILPISPLNEQKRIVEKVERLLGFCDRLEENLKNAEIKSAKLFDASINHREIG